MSNILTNSMNRLTKMLSLTDQKLKEMGTIPYGTVKLSPKQQREIYENLTQEDLIRLVNEHGVDQVAAWLDKKEKQYG